MTEKTEKFVQKSFDHVRFQLDGQIKAMNRELYHLNGSSILESDDYVRHHEDIEALESALAKLVGIREQIDRFIEVL